MTTGVGTTVSGKGDLPNPETWVINPLLSGVVNSVAHNIALSWVIPATGYPGAASYTLYRNVGGGAFTALSSGIGLATLAYTDSAVTAALVYQYYLGVVYGNGTVLVSNTITETAQ